MAGVLGLCPNIPYQTGLSSIKKALDSRSVKCIPTGSINKTMEFVLRNNYFEINKRCFGKYQGRL